MSFLGGVFIETITFLLHLLLINFSMSDVKKKEKKMQKLRKKSDEEVFKRNNF